jgi:hypothetical protein
MICISIFYYFEGVYRVHYDNVTVDTSPTGIGWVINEEGENDKRFPIRFGAKVLSERQRGYAQVKREL